MGGHPFIGPIFCKPTDDLTRNRFDVQMAASNAQASPLEEEHSTCTGAEVRGTWPPRAVGPTGPLYLPHSARLKVLSVRLVQVPRPRRLCLADCSSVSKPKASYVVATPDRGFTHFFPTARCGSLFRGRGSVHYTSRE